MAYNLTIKQGNLLDERNATFIVNASNTRLLLGSGVSMSFKRHCGIELQHEMSSKLESIKQPLTKGDVVATSSADATNFIYALHAAIMNYNQGTKESDKFPTLNDIKLALENIELYLEWYAKENTQPIKLVLPFLGCGVGGLQISDVFHLYESFFERNVSFDCNVVIYVYYPEEYAIIQGIRRLTSG